MFCKWFAISEKPKTTKIASFDMFSDLEKHHVLSPEKKIGRWGSLIRQSLVMELEWRVGDVKILSWVFPQVSERRKRRYFYIGVRSFVSEIKVKCVLPLIGHILRSSKTQFRLKDGTSEIFFNHEKPIKGQIKPPRHKKKIFQVGSQPSQSVLPCVATLCSPSV